MTLGDWTRANGRAPIWSDWKQAGPEHPCSCTVRNRFGSWMAGLEAASLVTRDAARRA